ncbi:nucleotidyl transferase AbiEii/AbiGii toxin family protein [Pyrococcus kukulkanii]|uniref:nucleotidyl transferase AbiEii/AbiGii toxin family protein n=1 Tax=Pyrococcus kukulkanii TaxID=1609559 RepID=UPI0035624313
MRELYSNDHFSDNYLFKGGTCLIKCYLGYYRFSVDLDFTSRNPQMWLELSRRNRERELKAEAIKLAELIEGIANKRSLEFKADLRDRNYVEFGGGSRMITFKLYYPEEVMREMIKIQVNFVETLLFEPKKVSAKSLLSEVKLNDEEKVYFFEFLEDYSDVVVSAYDLREILTEKVRALLTRKNLKFRDIYDLYYLEKEAGLRVEDYTEEIAQKLLFALKFERYSINFQKTIDSLSFLDTTSAKDELFLLNASFNVEDFKKFLERLRDHILNNLGKIRNVEPTTA